MCTHMYMVKNIAIMDSVYAELVKYKKEGESFSKEIMRFIGKKKSILEFAGAWKMTDKEADEMKQKLAQLRALTTTEMMNRIRARK